MFLLNGKRFVNVGYSFSTLMHELINMRLSSEPQTQHVSETFYTRKT